MGKMGHYCYVFIIVVIATTGKDQGCQNGTYKVGENCKKCGENCVDVCHHSTGKCTCINGTYGKDCAEYCSANCIDACSQDNGHCTCKRGWQPPLCFNTCSIGLYGDDCKNNCSSNCVDVCHWETGHCKCEIQWQPPLCIDVLDEDWSMAGFLFIVPVILALSAPVVIFGRMKFMRTRSDLLRNRITVDGSRYYDDDIMKIDELPSPETTLEEVDVLTSENADKGPDISLTEESDPVDVWKEKLTTTRPSVSLAS